MTQTLQLGVQPTFVVANLAAGGLLYKCTHLDTGNGAMLHQACLDAVALSPDARVFVMRGTYNRSLAGGPTSPTPIPGGGVRGEGRALVTITSTTSGDQGVFTNSAGGDLTDLVVSIQTPTAVCSGSTIAVDMGTSANAAIERVTLNFGTIANGTEAGNLVLRTGLRIGGRCSHVIFNGTGWKIRTFVAADTVGVTGGLSGCWIQDTLVNGFDVGGTIVGLTRYHFDEVTFSSPASNCLVLDAGPGDIIGCNFILTGGATSGDGISMTAATSVKVIGCSFNVITTGAGTHRGIAMTSSSYCYLAGLSFGEQFGGTIDVGIAILNDTCRSNRVEYPLVVGTVTTIISDAGTDTIGRGAGMTWRGTFTAGAGATTAYAGMGEAATEMAAGNAQKRFPCFGGVAFRLRVRVISNSMPASTVFTIMQDITATALAVTVGAAATGEFVSSGSVLFTAGDAVTFQTWDLRAVETGIGTIVFSAALELL